MYNLVDIFLGIFTKTQHNIMTLYHERQVGSYCRLHAINNLMGRQICSIREFDALCSEFDKMNLGCCTLLQVAVRIQINRPK